MHDISYSQKTKLGTQQCIHTSESALPQSVYEEEEQHECQQSSEDGSGQPHAQTALPGILPQGPLVLRNVGQHVVHAEKVTAGTQNTERLAALRNNVLDRNISSTYIDFFQLSNSAKT